MNPAHSSLASRPSAAALLTICVVAAAGAPGARACESAALLAGILATADGARLELQWAGEPGALYRVQARPSLDAGTGWSTVDVIRPEAGGAPVRWMAPEALGGGGFYRLAGPDPEIFSVEPAWVDSTDPAAALYIVGQCLPANATVLLNGETYAASREPGGALRVSLLGGALPGGSVLSSAVAVMDNDTSNIVATLPVQGPVYFGPAALREQLQGPPAEPPASPSASLLMPALMKAKEKANRTRSAALPGGPDQDCDGLESAALARGKSATKSRSNIQNNRIGRDGIDDDCDGVFAATGEFRLQETDLAIPGRGLHFAWTRTYRSRTGPATAQGFGWDFSYNASLTPQPDGSVVLRTGDGRASTFYRDGENGWLRDEYFVAVGDLDGDGAADCVTFPDAGQWHFHAPGEVAAGRLARIVDRNDNTVRCEYDQGGRLARVVDTLDRTNTVTYNAAGRIESIADFSGRVVRYEYDDLGDLVASVSPAVTGTPTGNDFPGGVTNRYAYTRGHTEARLNHNLIGLTDGMGQTWLQIGYQPATDPAALDFDAVATLRRGADRQDLWRTRVTPHPSNGFAVVKAVLRDAVGHVTENFYDSRLRCVRQLEYTGRSNPDLPMTDKENRPAGKLRADDPEFFETRWEWNPDSLCIREVRPNGDSTEVVHQRVQDHNSSRSNKTASRRHDGNARVVRERASRPVDTDGDGVAETTELAWHFEYDPRFGSPARRVQDHNSSRSNKSSSRLADGDSTPIIRGSALAAKPWLPANFRLKIGGLPASRLRPGGQPGGPVCALFEDLWPCSGDCDFNDLALRYAIRIADPRGSVTTSSYDSRGNLAHIQTTERKSGQIVAADFQYNARGQMTAVTHPADGNGHRRLDVLTYHGAGPQAGYLASIAIDEPGVHLTAAFEYDARGNVTRIVDPRTNDWLYTYNALDQLVERRGAVYLDSGGAPRIAAQCFYDANGRLIREDLENRDAAGALNPTNSHVTTLFEYDTLGRLTRLMEEEGIWFAFHTNEFAYDGNDRLVLARGPAAVHGLDPFSTAGFAYDERGLLFEETAASGSGNALTNRHDYDGNGNRVRVLLGPDFLRVTAWAYDGLGRVASVTDAMGNESRFTRDRNGNLVRAARYGELADAPGGAGNLRLAETRYEYDGLDRLVRFRPAFFDVFTQAPLDDGFQDNTFAYAPNGLVTRVANDRGHGTVFVFDTTMFLTQVIDAQSNRVEYACDRNGNVVSVSEISRPDAGGPEEVFTRQFAYDALNRRVADWDNAGNTNRYAYDSRNNLVRFTDARGNDVCFDYDALNRPVGDIGYVGPCDAGVTISSSHVEYATTRLSRSTDANGNTTQYAYDSLERLVQTTLADGTTHAFLWDARGDLGRATDANGSVTQFSHDLLGRCESKTIKPGAGVAGDATQETFGYDGFSRLTRAANNHTEVTRAYDSLGRCVREGTASPKLGLDAQAFHWAWSASGLLLAQTNPSTAVVEYDYDALDRPTSVSLRLKAGAPPQPLAGYSYAGPDRLARVTRANGVNTELAWSGLAGVPNAPGDFGWRRPRELRHLLGGTTSLLDARVFAHDRAQNKILRALAAPFAPGAPTPRQQFEYDALDRLVRSVTSLEGGSSSLADGLPASDRTYVLDANGNRQVVFGGGLLEPYQLDSTLPQPADFQVNQYTRTPFDQRQYDENGNLKRALAADPTDPGRAFIYDYADRLVAVEGAAGPVATYAYDALGRRIARVLYAGAPAAPVETNRFLRAGSEPIEERDGSGAVVRTYVIPHVFDQKGRIAVSGGGAILHLLCDDQGSTVAVTDAAGNVLERCDYDDYGLPHFLGAAGEPLTGADGRPVTASPSGIACLFHGMEWDAETGFYYDGRAFDPRSGRYLARAGIPLRWDAATSFAGNNPWSAKKEEGGRHTPFHNRMLGGALPGGAIVSAAVSSVSSLAGGGGGAAAASYAATGRMAPPGAGPTPQAMRIDGGMPNRISMNVTVPKQTQGATFGERVNAGLHAAGSAVAQGAARFRPAFFDVFFGLEEVVPLTGAPGPAPLGASGFAAGDDIYINPGRSSELLAHELAHVVQQKAGATLRTKHDTAKNSIGNIR